MVWFDICIFINKFDVGMVMLVFSNLIHAVLATIFMCEVSKYLKDIWGFGLIALMTAFILFFPIFQYWVAHARKLYLKKEATLFERLGTSFLAPLAPLGYSTSVVTQHLDVAIAYAFLVTSGVLFFSSRAEFVYDFLIQPERRDNAKVGFRKFPPENEQDMAQFKWYGFGMLIMPPIVGFIHK